MTICARCVTALLVGLASVSRPVPALAQRPPEQDRVESMSIRFGPFGLTPSIAVTDFGVDSNIFRDAETPQSDFTATITPRIDVRLRAGRLLLSAWNATGFTYYAEFDDQRSMSYAGEVRADLALGWLQPFATASVLDTRERLNAELDVRAPRLSTGVSAGARLLAGSRTTFTFTGRVSDQSFDEDTTFEGVSLARNLNSRVEAAEGGFELTLTPLTTFKLLTAFQRDRFDQSPERDADSVKILPGLVFDPVALIQGSLAVGYRRFTPLSSTLPDYTGLIMQSSLVYTLLERTRFEGWLTRDVQYSFEDLEPYYLSTGARLRVTQRVGDRWDVEGSIGRERLGYRALDGLDDQRTDRADLIGVGAGYRIRENARVALNWEYTERHSDRPDRRYERRRLFATFTFGQ
jgi:hypothetical protein